MYYHIELRLSPSVSCCVRLFPAWRELVAQSEIDQAQVDSYLESHGRGWLDGCGFDKIFDPDNCGVDYNPRRKPGLKARPMYRPGLDLRVRWGEWGPEHIAIPGADCGLDLDTSRGEDAVLLPHNVDTRDQILLLLLVFCSFADVVLLRTSTK